MRSPHYDFADPVIKDTVQIISRHRPCLQSVLPVFPNPAVQFRPDPLRQLGFSCVRQLRRAFEGRVQPPEQVTIDEPLMPQLCCQIRQRPPERRHELQVTQDEHGDERRPDLHLDRIGVRSKEHLDLESLHDRLEEQPHLRAIYVDRRNRRRSKPKMVGQKSERSPLFLIPDLDDHEKVLAVGDSLAVEEVDQQTKGRIQPSRARRDNEDSRGSRTWPRRRSSIQGHPGGRFFKSSGQN